MLPYLESRKIEIETAIGQPLLWNPNPTNRDKVISLLHETNYDDEDKIEEALNWLIEHTLKFREIFTKVIREMPN